MKKRRSKTTVNWMQPHYTNNVAQEEMNFTGTIQELEARLNKAWNSNCMNIEEYNGQPYKNEVLRLGGNIQDYEQAIEFLHNGSHEFLEKYLSESLTKFSKEITTSIGQNSYINDMEGLFIDIDASIKGLPECWLNTASSESNKFVKVVINTGCSYSVTNAQIFEKYKHVFNMVDSLEAAGTRCEIWIESLAKPSDSHIPGAKPINVSVLVKRYNEPFNIQQLVFLIASPYFLRFATFLLRGEYYGQKGGLYYSNTDIEKNGRHEDVIHIPSFYKDSKLGIQPSDYNNICEKHINNNNLILN